MASLAAEELTDVLRDDERPLACVSADGVHAGDHAFFPSNPHVLITDQRIVFLSRKGMMKKRVEQNVAWSLSSFTSRVNTSEGTALGPFMYFVTLFTSDGETVSAAFKNSRDRDAYKGLVVEALAPVLG
jgi:hypothetical protein